MDKPEFGRIIWGNFVDTRGQLTKEPHRAVILTSNADIDADMPIRVVVISSNLTMAAKEDMVLLPWSNESRGHILTKLTKKCAAMCRWLPLLTKKEIKEYGGWVRGKWMIQIQKRVRELDENP